MQWKTPNQYYYLDVLRRLRENVRKKDRKCGNKLLYSPTRQCTVHKAHSVKESAFFLGQEPGHSYGALAQFATFITLRLLPVPKNQILLERSRHELLEDVKQKMAQLPNSLLEADL